MTTDEIKRYIKKKIAGQGNQVDMGSALPTIFNFLLDGLDGKASSQALEDLSTNVDERILDLALKLTDKANRIELVHIPGYGDSISIEPNKFFEFTIPVPILGISLIAPEDEGILNVYMFSFTCAADPAITLPDDIVWNREPEFEEGKTYEITIRGNYGIINVW